MIKINPFVWNLYKTSPNGHQVIKEFQNVLLPEFNLADFMPLAKKYTPEYFKNAGEDGIENDLLYVWSRLKGTGTSKEINPDVAENIFIEACKRIGGYEGAIDWFYYISICLYKLYPSFFLPYLFYLRYNYLQQIIDAYDLDLGDLPGKASKEERCRYYLKLCKILYEFRNENGLNGPELCSFLFDMESQYLDSQEVEYENKFPNVWLISGGKHDKELYNDFLFWHSNPETKKGDIMLFYETGETESGNRCCLTGIWRALTDGFKDPLYHYYGCTMIGKEKKIDPIPFKVLKSDSRTNQLPRIGANFLGVSGDPVTINKYESLLDLICERQSNFDKSELIINRVPYEVEVKFEERGDMKPEKWVEEYLVIKLLKMMKWGRLKIDYRRQVYLQLGRRKDETQTIQAGKTDFSLFPFGDKDLCADVLIEVKAPGELDKQSQIKEVFYQAESYASRQYSGLIILCDADKLLLYPRNKDGVFRFFDTTEIYKWEEVLKGGEVFYQLRNRIKEFKKHRRNVGR